MNFFEQCSSQYLKRVHILMEDWSWSKNSDGHVSKTEIPTVIQSKIGPILNSSNLSVNVFLF